MTLGDLVSEYRAKMSLSQRQFANICGVSNGYISMLEKNTNPNTGSPLVPSLPILKKLADGMGITVNEIFAKVDDMPVELISDPSNMKKPAILEESRLDALDMELISLLENLSKDQKVLLLAQLQTLAEQQKSPQFLDSE